MYVPVLEYIEVQNYVLVVTPISTAKKREFKKLPFFTFSFITPEPSRNPSSQPLALESMVPPVSERRRSLVKVKVELGVPIKSIPSQRVS
jgi:hypothetical protein